MSNESPWEGIRKKLEGAFAPASLVLEDLSRAHAGHAGSGGGGHLSVRIVSARFAGISLVERHRMVYSVLSAEMGSKIHALALVAKAPGEN